MKKNINISLVLAIFFLPAPALLFSCKKDSLDTKEVLAYTPVGTGAYNVLSGQISIFRQTILSSAGTSFPVLLTGPFEKDVTITVKIDTSLISLYDSIYKIKSPRVPAGAFRLVSNTVTVKANNASSVDSIQLQVDNASNIPAGNTVYTVPVALVSADNQIKVSATRQIMFYRVTVTSTSIGLRSLNGTNSETITLSNVGGVNTGSDKVYLQTSLNIPIAKNTSATAQINSALVASYNTKNGTNYQTFPDGSYAFEKATAAIPANKTISTDSIAIHFPDLSKFNVGTDYLLPVELIENGDPATPPVDQTKKVAYIVLNIFVNNVDPSNPAVSGSVADRTAWQVSASSSYRPVEQAIDGDNATVWDSESNLPQWLQLDMGSIKTVKGFSIVPNYEYRDDDFLAMKIYSSNDGSVWKLEGEYEGTATDPSSDESNPDIKNVSFIKPVTARYFKFTVTQSNNDSYTGMGELNAIE
ncbi:MAG: DUF1735 domain-containing protein [Chitinophagaceae bacterium]